MSMTVGELRDCLERYDRTTEVLLQVVPDVDDSDPRNWKKEIAGVVDSADDYGPLVLILSKDAYIGG